MGGGGVGRVGIVGGGGGGSGSFVVGAAAAILTGNRRRKVGGGGGGGGGVGGGTYSPPSSPFDAIASAASSKVESYAARYGMSEIGDELGFGEGGRFESAESKSRREREEDRKNFWITFCHAVFASVTMVVSLFSIKIAQWGITEAAFGMTLGTAPYTVRQRRKLNKAQTFREALNIIRSDISRLGVQNDRLHESNNKLRTQVNRLKKVEEDLNAIITRQGHDAHKFRIAVKENAKVQEAMRRHLRAAATQHIVTAVLRSDRDRNAVFDDDEIDVLVHRMMLHPDLRRRDEDDIRRILLSGADRSMMTIMRKANEIYNTAKAQQ